jgi:VIT1/CCC1 family predicted Fe2+/Mn2+ transporter
MPLALRIILGFVAFGAVGVLFGWLAHTVALRYAAWALVPVWALATAAATTAMTARIHQQQTALGLTAAQQARFPVFWMSLPLWAVGLACGAFVVRRRSIASGGPFGRRDAIASFKAFLLGAVVYLVVFAFLDLTSIIHF